MLKIANGEEADGASDYCNRTQAAYVKDLLENIDVLVDGEFIQEQKSYDALYRGSKNQRLIDVPKSLQSGNIVL